MLLLSIVLFCCLVSFYTASGYLSFLEVVGVVVVGAGDVDVDVAPLFVFVDAVVADVVNAGFVAKVEDFLHVVVLALILVRTLGPVLGPSSPSFLLSFSITFMLP